MNKRFDGIRPPVLAEDTGDTDFLALEERLMFDGAAAIEVAEAAIDVFANPDVASEAQDSAEQVLLSAIERISQSDRTEIVFIDAGVTNTAELIAAIPDNAEVIMLDAGADGIEQIANALEGREEIDAIHIISHGENDRLILGNSELTLESIQGKHQQDLAQIGQALSLEADFLLYGCDFGQDSAALDALSNAVGADVAASDNETGAQHLGADWDLEVSTGIIQTTALSAELYDGVLALPEVTVPADALIASEDTDLSVSGVSVADADDDVLDVTLDVTNGTINLSQTTNLTVSGDGTGSISLRGTAADINNALNNMTYRAISNFNGSDTLTVEADDGSNVANESVGIEVASVNDAPTLTPTSPSADEGGSVTLTEANFGVVDPDLDTGFNTNPQLTKQLVFKLDSSDLPNAGNLLLNGTPLLAGSTFSLQDVIDGNLSYSHDGSDVSTGDTDDFAVTINDGGGSGDVGPTQIVIALQPVNQAPTINGNPNVFEGQGTEDEFANPGTVTETADIGGSLIISDRDDTVANSQITITNIDNASEGTLFWDADGDGQLDAGEALNGGETFAADELAAGRLRFAHDGDEVDTIRPSFDIEVTDDGGGAGSGSALSSGPQTIDITVNPNDDNPELSTNSSATVIAGVSETVVIGTSNLDVTDPDSPVERIVYVVTGAPAMGELRIDGEVLGVGGRFTQDDIDSGRIDYNSTTEFANGDTDTFLFEVRDSAQRAYNLVGLEGADRDPDGTVSEHTFTIDFIGTKLTGSPPEGPAPGRSGTIEVGTSTIGGVTVTESDGVAGGVDTTTITSSELDIVLQTTDSNGNSLPIAPEETLFRITAAPGNGTLWLDGAALGIYSTFTQADINAGLLTFTHDGSENHQDKFGFNVSGGTSPDGDGEDGDGEFEFSLNAIPVNDAPSIGTSSLPLMPEGATARVTASQIGLGDVDVDNEPGEGGGVSDPNDEAVADDLLFRITDLPDNGTLERWDGLVWVAVTTDDLLSSTLLTAIADGEVSGLRYVHDGSENHSDSFAAEVRDDLIFPGTFNTFSQSGVGSAPVGNISGTGTVNVTLAPQNDPPVSPENEAGFDPTVIDADGIAQTTANVPLYLPEGGNSVIDSSMLRSVDTDNTDPGTLQYRITQSPAFGLLTLGGNQLGVGSTFTQEDIDSGSLNYEHDGSENFADDFKFIVSDSVNDHVYVPDGATGASTFNIFVDPARNDLPEVVNNGSSTVDIFGSFSHNFGSDLVIADPDIDDGDVVTAVGETDFIQVTVTLKDSGGSNVDLSASGGITLGSTSGVTQTDSDDSDGDLVFQGTFTDVQAALTNLIVELPNQDQDDIFTLDLTVDDRLRDASGNLTGGANGDEAGTTNEDLSLINDDNNTDTVSVTFRASSDNDDPTATANPGDKTVNEDTVLDLSGYVIDDPDAFDSELTVDLAVTNGHLSVTGNATTSDPSSLTLTGTLSEINAQLDNLTYIADENFHSPDNFTNSDDDTLTITLNDGGSNGAGGGADVTGPSVDIAINPVNDAPTLTVPATQTIASGTSITLSGSDAPTVADARDASNTPFNDVQRLTVSVPTGKGTLTGSGNSGLTDQDGSAETLVLVGTLAEINDELNGLTFAPSDPNADETVTITVEFNDQANGGTALTDGVGGALTAIDTFDVQISGINDGPTVTPPVDQNVDEDDSLTFSSGLGNAFTVSDPDDFGAEMVATVSVDHGIVSAASSSGAALSGDGSSTLTITGTESEINAALDGLVYTPDSDFHTAGVAGDTITVAINDQGNTGTGGALTDSQSAEIAVDPVNDRPTASGGPETVTVTGEHQAGAGVTLASLLSGNFDDSTDDQTTDGGDASTALSFVAITGSTGYDVNQGTWQVSDGSGGWIDVPRSGLDASNALVVDASREIRFNPADDFHGTPGTLDVRLADGDAIDAIGESSGAGDLKNLSSEGGTGETGRWSADTVTLNTSVTNENDPPSASDATLTAIDEDNNAPTGETVGNLFTPVFEDTADDQTSITGGADASTPLGGIAVIGSSADAANEGMWQYSTDSGANWTDIPEAVADDTNAILLPNNAQLRFVPVLDFNGTPGALDVRLADATQTFSSSADISGDVGDDVTRDTDIWSAPVNLNTSVTPVNDAPSASPSQDFTIGEDDGTQTVNGFMQSIEQGGGSDEDSQTVTFSIESVSDGTNFTAAELFDSLPNFTDATDADNTIEFTASDILAEGETETVTVTVGVTDDGGTDNGGDDTGTDQTFTITITGVNDAPTLDTAQPDLSNTDGEMIAPVDISGNFSDPDATDTLTFSATGLPPGLSIDPNTGVITGTIDADASTGGPYNVTVTANDGSGTATATQSDTFAWEVNNLPPVAEDDTDTTDEETAISRNAANGVIDPNDSDAAPDGDALTVDQVDGATGNVASAVAGSNGGQFTINADGSYDFDPDGAFNDLAVGESRMTSVNYRITDGQGGTDTATLTVTVTGVNDAPTLDTAQPDLSNTDGEMIAPVDISGNFSDPDATDTLTFSATGLPPGLSIDPNTGVITGTIDADASTGGPYNVTVTANDGSGTATATQSDTFAWEVNNLPPVAEDDTDTTDEETAISRNAANGVIDPNDSDAAPDGDALTVDQVDGATGNVASAVAGSNGGQFTINADGSYDFDPDGAFNDLAVGESRMTSVNYRITDGQGGTDTATLTVTVTGVNDAPAATADSVTTDEDLPVSGNVISDDLGNGLDSDIDGDDLTVAQVVVDTDGDGNPDMLPLGTPTPLTDAAGDPIGTLIVSTDGSFTFTPAPDYDGPVPQATYTISDGEGGTSAATLDITITPLDDPIAITGLTDGAVVGTDGSVEESGLTDGTTPDDDGETLIGAFTVSVVDGITSLSVDGTIVTEAQLLDLAATPVTVPTGMGVLTLTGFDPDTGAVSYSYELSDDVSHSSGAVTDDIALELTDGDGDTATGTLSVAVLDDVPVANADADEAINTPLNPSSVAHGNVVTGVDASSEPNTTDGVADAIGADGAATGGPVTGVVFGTGTPVAGNIATPVAGTYGTLVLNADGSYSYTPTYADPTVMALGPNDSLTEVFSYEITDSDGSAVTTTLSVTILGTPAIAGLGDGAVPGTDGAVLESDLVDGSNAAGTGDVLNGSFQAIAPKGIASVTVAGTTLTEAQLQALTPGVPAVITSVLGTLELTGYDSATGIIDYVYTLSDDVDHSSGDVTDDFAVSVTDTPGDTGTGTLSVAVLDDAPEAVNDIESLSEDDAAPVTGNVVTSNDVLGADETPSPVTGVVAGTGTPTGNVGTVVAGSFGDLTLNSDGSYSYELDTANTVVQGLQDGETLTETFSYEITDADGDTSTATLTLTITGVNDAPVASPDIVVTDEDTPVSGSLNDNDTDVDGDTVVISAATVDINGDGSDQPLPLDTATVLTNADGEEIGTLTISSSGTFSFDPALDYDGPVPLVGYTISDGNGGSDSSTLLIEITPVLDAVSQNTEYYETTETPRERLRAPLIVDHIVGGTVNSTNSLNSTPALLSGLNTSLGVQHPILTAVNALQDLDGTQDLNTEGRVYFGGIAVENPISQAVQGIGFDPLVEEYKLYSRDFPDGVREHFPSTPDAPSTFAPFHYVPEAEDANLVARHGYVVALSASGEPGQAGVVVEVKDASGTQMKIQDIKHSGHESGVEIHPNFRERILVRADGAETSTDLKIALENGHNIELGLEIGATADGDNISLSGQEKPAVTFTAQTEEIARAGEVETARLLRSIT